ncbi:DUF7738 domain-containing protein, partial [Zooshikella harenae]
MSIGQQSMNMHQSFPSNFIQALFIFIVISTTIPCYSSNLTITLNDRDIEINNKAVFLDTSIDNWFNLLGKPDRTTKFVVKGLPEEYLRVAYTWDKLGLAIESRLKTNKAHSLLIMLDIKNYSEDIGPFYKKLTSPNNAPIGKISVVTDLYLASANRKIAYEFILLPKNDFSGKLKVEGKEVDKTTLEKNFFNIPKNYSKRSFSKIKPINTISDFPKIASLGRSIEYAMMGTEFG